MLHNETRNLLIQAYNKTHNAKEVAECFSVDVSTVYRLVEQMKREGSVSVKTSLRGRKASLKEADLQKIQELVQQKPNITLQEIIDTLQLKICIETVRKALIKLGYSYKKKSLHASEQEKRRSWNGTMSGINAEHLVFLDESGINTNLTRLYAHALHWKRAVDAAPLNTPTATTVLSSIRLDGTTIFTTYQGGTTAA